MTPAIRTYLQNHDFANKKLAFFTTQGGDEPVDAIAEMKQMVDASTVIAVLSLREDTVKADRYEARLKAFVARLKS